MLAGVAFVELLVTVITNRVALGTPVQLRVVAELVMPEVLNPVGAPQVVTSTGALKSTALFTLFTAGEHRIAYPYPDGIKFKSMQSLQNGIDDV